MDGPEPLTADEVARLRESFAIVATQPRAAGLSFYETLFEKAPGTRAMFPDNLGEQALKLMRTLQVVVTQADDLASLEGAIADLGRRHADMRVTPEHYDLVGEALDATFAKTMGASYDDATRNAWMTAYRVISARMQDAQNASR